MEKPTLKQPTEQGKAFEKNYKSTNAKAEALIETDVLLNEKEHSLKKKIFDLSKMEALVHTDEKLSGIYNKMAEDGEELYGYHYNETIMNIIFNDYILNDPMYLEKYKNAIPKEKKRRDKSGIKQLQDAGVGNEDDTKVENIEETTSAGGSAGVFGGESRASGYSYEAPFGTHRDKKLDKPAWNGGSVLENYLVNPTVFKNMINEENFFPEEIDKQELSEQHLSSREDKINFIIQHTDDGEFSLSANDFEMMSDDEIDQMYYDTEQEIGMYEEINLGDDVELYEKTTNLKSPEVVNEENYKRLRKIEYYDVFNELQTIDDLQNGTIPDDKLSKITDKPVKVTFDDDTQERLTLDEFNRLYSHNNEVEMDVIDKNNINKDQSNNDIEEGILDNKDDSIINGNQDSMKMKQEPSMNMAVSSIGGIHENNETNEYVEFYKDYVDEAPFIKNGEKYKYVWAKYPDGKIDLGVYSHSGDVTYDYKWFRKNILGMNESINENENLTEDGHCRKDEVPVPGKTPGEDGSCKKKNKTGVIRPEEKKRSPHNIQQREKRIHDYEKKKNKNMTENENALEELEKDLNEMKSFLNTISEDRRPSSLVTLDRLKKDNETNFKSAISGSNIKDSIDDIGDTNNDLITIIDDPQKLSADIEKEKLSQNKGESFENVGNSTNENNKEIPKRNHTDDEMSDIDKMRMGMEDFIYDNKPDERFESRMKEDMGENMYKKRQDKLEYRSKAPMYNKDTQPIDDGEDVTQFDKSKSKFNTNKGINENFMFTGKYKDMLNNTKFVNFHLNECVEIQKSTDELFKLNFEGLGNRYTQSVNENTSFSELEKYTYYTDGDSIYKIKKLMNEAKTIDKTKKNIDISAIKKLMNYKSSDFLDINTIKRNRGF